MAVVASDIKTRWPSTFGSLSDATVTAKITLVSTTEHSAEQWGEKSDNALACLVAHRLKQDIDADAGGTAPGPVQSEREGPASVVYATVGVSDRGDMDLASTSYGRMYQSLGRGVFPERF